MAAGSLPANCRSFKMKYYSSIALSLFVTLISSCTSTKNYESILNTWINDTEQNLVSRWGPPQGFYISPEGDRILTYHRNGTIELPGYEGPSTTYLSGTNYGGSFHGTATTYGNSSAPTTIYLSCQTNFTVKNGRITTWSYQGNNCRA